MFKNKSKVITFTNALGYPSTSEPQIASKVLPEWYKEMPAGSKEINTNTMSGQDITIKKCMPVFDAISAGYILSTPADMYVYKEGGVQKTNASLPNLLSHHPRRQAYLHPSLSENLSDIPKYINGWLIETPKGYSCLLIPPMHNPNPWFEILEGIVDTDSYSNLIHFPFKIKDPNFEGIIPMGTPMVQIIPFKRDVWKKNEDINNENRIRVSHDTHNRLNAMFFNRYKKLFWTPKVWNSKD
jgi:hypothetical protein